MDNTSPMDSGNFQRIFGMQENLPGGQVDYLVLCLGELHPSRWIEACQAWMGSPAAQKFPSEEANLIVQLARMYAGRKVGGVG